MSFLDHYLEHNKRYESPTSFWKWASYGAIACVLRDNVYQRRGDNKLFPNVYILILAESSFHRKGRPPEFSEDLVRECKITKVISGRASIQAIVQELSRTETDKGTGKIIKGGSAVFFAPEMAASLVADPAAIGILTDIYETKKNYDSLLKTQAKTSITNLVFSMIAASNEELLKSVYDGSALRGGLLARTFLVVPDEFRPPNSLLDISDEEYEEIKRSKAALIKKLQKIGTLAGEMRTHDDAQRLYDKWYNPFRRGHQTTKDRSGLLGRIHVSILKLAIILAANDNRLCIEARHMEQAIDECVALVPNYTKLSLGGANNSIREAGTLVLNDLLDSPTNSLTRRELFQRHLLDFDSTTFDTLIVNLETAGIVVQHYGDSGNGSGNSVTYALTQKAIETLKGV